MLQNVVFMFYVPALQLTTLHGHGNTTQLSPTSGSGAKAPLALLHSSGDAREVLMGVGDGVASVIMLTFTKRPGPHADFYKEARPPC